MTKLQNISHLWSYWIRICFFFVLFSFFLKLLKHEIFGLEQNFKLKKKCSENRRTRSCFFPEAIDEHIQWAFFLSSTLTIWKWQISYYSEAYFQEIYERNKNVYHINLQEIYFFRYKWRQTLSGEVIEAEISTLYKIKVLKRRKEKNN